VLACGGHIRLPQCHADHVAGPLDESPAHEAARAEATARDGDAVVDVFCACNAPGRIVKMNAAWAMLRLDAHSLSQTRCLPGQRIGLHDSSAGVQRAGRTRIAA
jgi:hypothetical protein